MKNDPTVTDLSNIGANRFPHLKITNEKFPRVLATRLIEDDGAEYFGAFLPKTAARTLIDFVNRTFRLRSCDITIDGSFEMPCTQYFRRRCVAPCVSRLCSLDEYLQIVDLVRLFLRNDRSGLVKRIETIIDELSRRDDFEAAARYRDLMIDVDKFWNQARQQVWVDDAIDTYAVDESDAETTIYLVTHRGRRVLGRKVFVASSDVTPEIVLSKLIESFYLFHLPKEIRIPFRIAGRGELEEQLSRRFGRQAKITVSDASKRGANAFRGLNLSHSEHLLDKAKPLATPESIAAELAQTFDLESPPTRVKSFDVAHISGTGFAAASAVWENGRFLSADYRFVLSEERSELDALASAVRADVIGNSRDAGLIVLDGGKNQLNKVTNAVDISLRPPIAAAVKPPGKHSSIAAFLTESGKTVPFDPNSPAHAMLQLLRDEAHDLSNRVHRDYREMLPFYEVEGYERPLIVPLRFHAENGGGEDLLPIRWR
jgi:excinuclease ABC subunit C